MKTLLHVLLSFILMSACNKASLPKLPESEFTFLLDGKAYAFNGSLYANKGSILERQIFTPEYVLIAKAGFDTWLQAKITETEIKVRTYSVSLMMSLDGKRYDHSTNGTVTISSLHNNLASGTFSGEISETPGSSSITISNGRFKDVLVR